jgi:dihydrofolate reductase
VARKDALQAIADLKAQEGRNILMFGSRTLWNHLLVNGLVDEVHLMISPVVVGGGTAAFQDVDARTLTLVGTQGWPGSGLVLARYAPYTA